ncbi:helix-turn-helix domain-containing protein [Umezawaea sp. Da 62-37]|uniref:helix-turn-helix domain-containing protein n=1 Tax=Umezawaea sp. Da 62-37 TaxID=3075927 RepID=UPI0028F6E1ED|nr:hypothetical protein [Umezawaea sp. Da 62-37]WNV92195.1 hypothetical protein RM788_43915 [Umezawaea sp. Da 62-37]
MAQEGEFRDRYEKGEAVAAIATSVGKSRNFVKNRIVKAGGTLRPMLSPEQRRKLGARLRAGYEKGATIAELTTPDIGSESQVRKLLHEAGTTMRPPSRRRKKTDHCPTCTCGQPQDSGERSAIEDSDSSDVAPQRTPVQEGVPGESAVRS